MKRFFQADRLVTALPLIVALGLSGVISQLGQKIGASAFGDDARVANAAQPLLGDTQSVASARAIPVSVARNASPDGLVIPATLTVEDFDMTRARAMIAASALSGTEKALFARALDAAIDRPEFLAEVLDDLHSALQRQS